MKASEKSLSKIIKLSSDLMGLTEKNLSSLLEKELSFNELSEYKLSIGSYLKLTSFYLITEYDVFHSYNQEWHINRICYSILSGDYPHKLSPQIKKHLRAYKKKQWKEEASLYGFRLRWQIRINRIFNTDIKLPSLEEIFPYWLRKIAHRIKKYTALKIHLFKYGSYKDFCYYDIRYDPQEECRSSYFEELFESKNKNLVEAN